MIELILAIAVVAVAALAISSTIVLALKLRSLEKDFHVVAECLYTYILHPELMEIIDENTTLDDYTFNFPNSEGF